MYGSFAKDRTDYLIYAKLSFEKILNKEGDNINVLELSANFISSM